MVSVCLPSDALLQHLLSYLGFSYLGCGVSLHGCSSKAQPLLLTLDEGYLLRTSRGLGKQTLGGLPEDWGNRLLEDMNKTCAHQDPGKSSVTHKRLSQTCLCASRKWKWGQAVEEPVSDSSNEKGGRRRAERGVVGHPFLNWMSNSAVLRRRWVPSLRFHLKDNSCSIRVAPSLSHLLISHLAGLLLACALKWLDPATWWPSLLPCHF